MSMTGNLCGCGTHHLFAAVAVAVAVVVPHHIQEAKRNIDWSEIDFSKV
jgi:hypothetical protein